MGATMLVASALVGLAGVAAESEQAEHGARLLGAAEAIAESLGAPLIPRDHPIRDRGLAALTAALGEHRLAGARLAGCALTVEAAIADTKVMAETVHRAPR